MYPYLPDMLGAPFVQTRMLGVALVGLLVFGSFGSSGAVGGGLNAGSTDSSWFADGLTHFVVTLERGQNGFGFTMFQRHESYHQSVPGDNLGASTAAFPVVSEVVPGSSAERAGLLVGDVILAVQGQSVQRQSLQEIGAAIKSMPLVEWTSNFDFLILTFQVRP